MKVINIINQKGGAGKTTITVNMAVGLAQKGYKVLVVDADAQGNTTLYFSADSNELSINDINNIELESSVKSNIDPLKELEKLIGNITFKKDINDVLLQEVESIKDAIYETQQKNLYILPSTGTKLTSTDQKIKLQNTLQHNRLKKALKEVRKEFDYVIIDNAPTFNTITTNTLFCSDEIIIPIKIGKSELAGYVETMKQLKELTVNYECDFTAKLLLNMIPRGNRPKYKIFVEKMIELFDGYNEVFETKVFKTNIGFQEAVATNSGLANKLIINTNTNVGNDYKNLINEYLNLDKNNEFELG